MGGITMKTIFNIIIALLLGSSFTTLTMPKESMMNFEWIGSAIGFAVIFIILFKDKSDKDDIERRIKDIEDRIS